MHEFRSWLSAALLVSVSTALLVSTARADERTDARREFRVGMEAVVEGRFDEAIVHLERAYETLPHPNVLYNIGLAHMYAGRPEQAISYFEQYKEAIPPSDAAEVDDLIASLRKEQESKATLPEPLPADKPRSYEDVATELTATERELRRTAEQTGNEDLRRQADAIAAAISALRASAPPAAAQAAESTPTASATDRSPGAAQKQDVRQGAYEEEVVSASRFAQSPLDAPNAISIITAQDIRMTGLLNLSDLLRRVMGVEVTSVSPTHAEVSIRGLNRRSSNKVLFLVDGRSQRLDFNGTSFLNHTAVQLENVERIEIIKGPASALYGADAFSGIINVITRKPGKGKPFVLGSYGSNNQARGVASFTGESGKLSYRYSSSYMRADNAVIPVGPDRIDVVSQSNTPNLSKANISGEGELHYDATKDTKLTVGGSAQYYDTTVQGLSRLGQVTSNDAWQTNVYTSLAMPRGFKLSSWYDHLRAQPGPSYVTPGAIDVPGKDLKQDLADVDLSWSTRFKLLVPQSFTLGGGYRYKRIEWAWLDGPHSQHHLGIYFQDVLELAKPLTLQLGARLDHHPLLQSPQFSPRGSLVYRFLAEQSLRLSIGRAFRGPSFLESYLELPNGSALRGATGLGLGNDKLDPESIVSYELGYQNQASDYFALEANVYLNTVKDAILFTDIQRFPLSDQAGGNPLAGYDPTVQAFPFSSISFTNERATFRQMGAEIGIRVYPVQGLDIYTNYSIHDTSPLDTAKLDPVRAKEQQTSLHKANGGVQYRAHMGLDLSADVSWTSAQVWVEQVSDAVRGVRFQTFDVQALTMVNARVGYRFLADRLELGLVGTNLAFQHQRQHPFAQPLDTRVLATVRLRLQ